MQVIYKYKLAWQPVQVVQLPLKRVLTIQLQNGTPCLWALVDTDAPEIPLTLRMAGTGTRDGCDFDTLRYINTTQFGTLVLHWFSENLPGANNPTPRKNVNG